MLRLVLLWIAKILHFSVVQMQYVYHRLCCGMLVLLFPGSWPSSTFYIDVCVCVSSLFAAGVFDREVGKLEAGGMCVHACQCVHIYLILA